jgi:hypothetical protein
MLRPSRTWQEAVSVLKRWWMDKTALERRESMRLPVGTRGVFEPQKVQGLDVMALVLTSPEDGGAPLALHAPVQLDYMAPGLTCEQADDLRFTWVVGN